MDALSPVATILLLKTSQKCSFMLPFASSFKIFINVFTFLYVKANSKEIHEEILFSSSFRKMLMSAFLLRFKANYLENMRGYPHFSFWIPIAFAMIYFFAHGANLAQKPPYLVGTVLNNRLFGSKECLGKAKS